jgi:lipid-A-disaccharide synthase
VEPEIAVKIFILAGEPSGDLHGKNLVRELQTQHDGPIEFRGVGGDGLAEEGVHLVRHIRETNFMGFVQVIANLGKIRKLFRDVKADILEFRPDAVILIDYPGFNLRLAKFLHGHGIKVLYYISPQVWAWKKGRVKQIKAYTDRMYVILPFEKDFFAKEGLEVDFVGHPLLDEVQSGAYQGAALRAELLNAGQRLVALLPGSRKQEISRMLPAMLEMVPHFPNCRFVVAGAPTQDAEFYASIIGERDVAVVSGRTYDLLDGADAALVTSGTATLETALFGVPEVVCYAAGGISVFLARRLIKVKYISLVNLVLDRLAVKELIQKDLNTESLRSELRALLDDPIRRGEIEKDYAELRQLLGESGASANAAKAMLGRI